MSSLALDLGALAASLRRNKQEGHCLTYRTRFVGSGLDVVGGIAMVSLCACSNSNDDFDVLDVPLRTASDKDDIAAWVASKNVPEEDVVARIVTARSEYDCVPWIKQPALKHRRGQRLTAPTPPPEPANLPQAEGVPARSDYALAETQCPSGTVVIERFVLSDELARLGSLDEVQKALKAKERAKRLPSAPSCPAGSASDPKFYEVYSSELSSAKPAMAAKLHVGNPDSNGMSLGQMWVTRHKPCTSYSSSTETIESGWAKFDDEDDPRFFVFYTGNGYGSDTCWNEVEDVSEANGMYCLDGTHPFVVTGGSYNVGGYLADLGGGVYGYLEMHWILTGGAWWLWMTGGWVGYYDDANFNSGLESGFTWPQIGGEVDNDVGTQMGNGNWGSSSSAAYAKWWWSNGLGESWQAMPNAYYVGSGNISNFWQTSGTSTGTLSADKTWFRFGGPGPGWD